MGLGGILGTERNADLLVEQPDTGFGILGAQALLLQTVLQQLGRANVGLASAKEQEALLPQGWDTRQACRAQHRGQGGCPRGLYVIVEGSDSLGAGCFLNSE